jgi:hypothetical protein
METTWETQAQMGGSYKINLREVGWEGMDWIQRSQDRNSWWAFVNKVMNFQVP